MIAKFFDCAAGEEVNIVSKRSDGRFIDVDGFVYRLSQVVLSVDGKEVWLYIEFL